MAGQNAEIRYGFEKEEGVPGTDSTFPAWATEDIRMGRPYEADPNLDASGNETEGDNLKAEGTWKLNAAPNSESFLQMRAHQHGFYEHEEVEAGVELWELRDFDPIEDDAVSHYMGSLWFGVWRDQRTSPSEYMAYGAQVDEFTLSVEANKYVMFEHSGLYLRDTYMATPSEIAVNAAYTGAWVVRGHRQGGDENGTDIVYRISTGGAIGVAKLNYGSGHDLASLTSVGTVATATTTKPHGLTTGDLISVLGATPAGYNVVNTAITVTGASTFTYAIVSVAGAPATGTLFAMSFGATEYLIANDWMDAHTAADLLKGTRREPVQIRPTPESGDVFTVGDAWRILPSSTKPVPVTSSRGKLNGTELLIQFSLDGGTTAITTRVDDFTAKMGTPREAKFSLGSKYAYEIGFPDNSKKWWELSFNRSYVDMNFERALIGNRVISAYAKFYGALIGSTGQEDFAEFTWERTKLSAAGAVVSTPGDLPEQITLRAFSENGSPLCIERYQNTVASIAPS